jgi:mannose-6-phosphate isomerase-like protein (cupin superfamily)
MNGSRDPGLLSAFEDQGFLGPVPLFSEDQCRAVLSLLEAAPPPPAWSKGNAASSRAFFGIGCLPELLAILEVLIGPDVMLWGAKLVNRGPGQVHPWHTDIETSEPGAGTVSVWIGLKNVDRQSALEVISRSHRFGKPLQDFARAAGKSRDEVTDEEVEAWSRLVDPGSERIRFNMRDGDAIVFDGRLWHGSNNRNPTGVRSALLLQYAVPSRWIRIPDLTKLDPPFRYEEEAPPCVMVLGRGDEGPNRIVPPPPLSTSWVHSLRLPLAGEGKGWDRHPVAAGATPCLEHLTCHASVLAPGVTPHKPHRHLEEEVLIVLDGEARLVIVDDEGGSRKEDAGAGTLVYYPSGQRHTIHNPTEQAITYFMFKWRNGKPTRKGPGGVLRTAVFRPATAGDPSARGDLRETRRVFEGPTEHLRWLHCHRSTVAPAGGYEPHVDPYDVAILVLEGSIETLGQRCEPHDMIFYAAGEPHGLRNPGDGPASYLVLEFHASARTSLTSRLRELLPTGLVERMPEPVLRLAKRVLDRIPA